MGFTLLVAKNGLEERWPSVLANAGLKVVPDLRSIADRIADAEADGLLHFSESNSHEIGESRFFCIDDSNVRVSVSCSWEEEFQRYTFGIAAINRDDALSGVSNALLKRVHRILKDNGAEEYEPEF